MPRKSGLLEIVERQQAALKRERDTLAAQAEALGLGLRMEVRSAVTDGLATAATDSVQAGMTVTEPLLGKLEGVVVLVDRKRSGGATFPWIS